MKTRTNNQIHINNNTHTNDNHNIELRESPIELTFRAATTEIKGLLKERSMTDITYDNCDIHRIIDVVYEALFALKIACSNKGPILYLKSFPQDLDYIANICSFFRLNVKEYLYSNMRYFLDRETSKKFSISRHEAAVNLEHCAHMDRVIALTDTEYLAE
ncbi:MAG: hypothetical protein LBI56_01215 [Puniceicoccales bacterium]|nr:hypothetical protein [Puniceicoccales bacterium]